MPRQLSMLDSVHRMLSRSAVVTRAAILLRNQCRAVIKYRLATGHQIETSGEDWLIRRLALHCRTFVDVGANRGLWSAAMLRHAPAIERGVAFEPGRRAAEMLRERLRGHPEVLVVERALSSRTMKSARFYEVADGGHTSSLVAPSESGSVEIEVEVSTLDAEASRLGLDHVDFLKVDVEGHDSAVLQGAEGLLNDQRIRFLQWEYGDSWATAGSTLAAALSFLKAFGYQSFLLKTDGAYRFDYDRFGEFFTFANFVSVQEGDVPLLAPVRDLL